MDGDERQTASDNLIRGGSDFPNQSEKGIPRIPSVVTPTE